jgi:hypothetical protein
LSLVARVIRIEPESTVSGNVPVTVKLDGVKSTCDPLIGDNSVGVVVVGGIWCDTFMTTPVKMSFSPVIPVTMLVELVNLAMS